MIFVFGEYKVDIDVNKTKKRYDNADKISEGCTCDACINFEKAFDLLPKEVTNFFSKLGIDPKKMDECFRNCTNDDGSLFYSALCYLSGTVLEGESAWEEVDTSGYNCYTWNADKAYEVTNGFYVSFENAVFMEDESRAPIVKLEISANIPWVLEKENHYL